MQRGSLDTRGLERRGPHAAERGGPSKETEEQPDPGAPTTGATGSAHPGVLGVGGPAECQDTLQALGKPCQSWLGGLVVGELARRGRSWR